MLFRSQLDLAKESLLRRADRGLTNGRTRLKNSFVALRARSPGRELVARRQYLLETRRRLGHFARQRLTTARARGERAASLLRILGPDATLERGYSITFTANGQVIRRVAEAKTRTRIKTRVRDGEFESTVS